MYNSDLFLLKRKRKGVERRKTSSPVSFSFFTPRKEEGEAVLKIGHGETVTVRILMIIRNSSNEIKEQRGM